MSDSSNPSDRKGSVEPGNATSLTLLDLKGTKVTAAGVKQLAGALPKK